MKETLLTRKDDGLGLGGELFDSIKWAFEEHLKIPDDPRFNSAVLYGNEDSPEMIEFYKVEEPLITTKVDFVWRRPQEQEE